MFVCITYFYVNKVGWGTYSLSDIKLITIILSQDNWNSWNHFHWSCSVIVKIKLSLQVFILGLFIDEWVVRWGVLLCFNPYVLTSLWLETCDIVTFLDFVLSLFFCAESMKNFLLVKSQIHCLQSKITYSSLQKQKKKSLIIWNVVMFRELYSNELYAVHNRMHF